MKITIPELSLVVLIGPSGSGKSTFAARHFKPTEVLSSDEFRGLVSDDENDQSVTKDAFDALHFVAGKRLALGRLSVVDATNVQREARRPLVELARSHHTLPVAIVFDLPERLCIERNSDRPDRNFGPRVVRQQLSQLRRSLRGLDREGFRRVFVLRRSEDVEAVEIEREPSWTDRSTDHGPFDIIGDVHGCYDELVTLLEKLGYAVADDGSAAVHAEGRKAVFLGDVVDRGPNTPAVLRLVMGMVASGSAVCVPGNHENKLVRALRGRDVQVTHGLAESLAQLERETAEFRQQVLEFLDGLVSHFVLADHRLVVAHAGMREEMQGRASAAVRAFALFGETTGETDEFGLPVRYPWATEYRGRATVVYGHTPVTKAEWVNNTINIDTGCVFGGALTALRYPERELISVPAAHTYYEPVRAFLPVGTALEATERDDLLDIEDVLGKRIVEARLQRSVTVREENARAALEVMSRFAADPRWLIYLPPTMSPPGTSAEPELLEHPAEAFAYYRKEGVGKVICQEKHMGSRAIVIVCRDDSVGPRRFRIDGTGICHTRTGRPFFEDVAVQNALLARVRAAVDAADLWSDLETDWLALDCELLPWSAKALELLKTQYAAVGASSRAALSVAVRELEAGAGRGVEVEHLLARTEERFGMSERFVDAYRRYCWNVETVDDLALAPFQILAGEGHSYVDRDHVWHMTTVERLALGDGSLVRPTRHIVVDLDDPERVSSGIRWWEELTEAGGEGMVVKPLDGIVHGRRGLVQPGVKVRGREYLRIIYGPEYTASQNMERLRERSLGHKRSLAAREFALGVEGLERFVRGEPLYRVHECVFGVLALESEPVDPRL
ncbi:MAG TPA: polynucleotide kinase-phosphatase [Actinomycetota bacterium]